MLGSAGKLGIIFLVGLDGRARKDIQNEYTPAA